MGKDYAVEIARMESKLAALKAKAKSAQRKDDSRRKILVGATILAAIEKGALRPEPVVRLLDNYLTQPRDRRLFADGPLRLSTAKNESAREEAPPAIPPSA